MCVIVLSKMAFGILVSVFEMGIKVLQELLLILKAPQ